MPWSTVGKAVLSYQVLPTELHWKIHEYLVTQNITSYLVIGENQSPNENRLWISPVGLTSKRIGSFVTVACPGQLARIQDSIRGSGGTIRSVVYSEEWPWIDVGSEAFRFDRVVLSRLASGWTESLVHCQWMIDFISQCLLPATRAFPRRTEFLLEGILGQFSPSLYPEITDIRLKMLFHTGFPHPGVEEESLSVSNIKRNTSKLCERIVDRCRKEDDLRQSALYMVSEVFDEDEYSSAANSLNMFLDTLGQSQTQDLGPLAFHECWGNDHRNWLRLHANRLEQIFELIPRKHAELSYRVECDRAIISSDYDVIATFHGEDILVAGMFKLPVDEVECFDWSIRLSYRGRTLESESIHSSEGEFSFLLDTKRAFSRYRRGIPLKLEILSNGEIREEKRIRVHLCGDDRQAFTLIEPSFEVVDASLHYEDEVPDHKIEANEPVYVYLFSQSGIVPVFSDLEENEFLLLDIGLTGIWRSGERIDPSTEASSQIVRQCEFGELYSVICFETSDIVRGEFTIEDELRVHLTSTGNGRIKDLLQIFKGDSSETYRFLGKLNDCSRKRILLSSDMTNERGWRPHLVDLLGSELGDFGAIGNYVTHRGTVSVSGFGDLAMPGQVVELVQEYSTVRFELIKRTKNEFEPQTNSSEHPDYAVYPIYLERCESEIQQLLMKYLSIYCALLDYIDNQRDLLEWNQIFVLTYLDCVVHWDNSTLRNNILFVGPWHPLVLAKRFMIQAELVERAKRLYEGDGRLFRRLTVLLKGIHGFRWIPGLYSNDKQFEPLYVTQSSDPGWHVAFKSELGFNASQEGKGSLQEVLEHIKGQFGLETSLHEGNPEDLVSDGTGGFIRAFPSRRSLGIRVRRGYSTSEVISSVDRFIHNDHGPSDMGKQLPGGIRLVFEDNISHTEEARWSNPPILLYHYEDDSRCFKEIIPDIYMLPPEYKLTFNTSDTIYELPRGNGTHAVFSAPLTWLTEGQTQLPVSITQEIDTTPKKIEELGDQYIEGLAKACDLLRNKVVMVNNVDLPERLDCPWALAPGAGVDPAVFVKYVQDGTTRSIQDRALWDYKVDIGSSQNSYYVLSTVPRGFTVAVNGFFDSEDIASEFIEELGAVGIAIGGEALKSGRHALGVIGLVGAIRMLSGSDGNGTGAFVRNQNSAGFLIPVDPFASFFGNRSGLKPEADDQIKRTDLMAIQLVLHDIEGENLAIYASGIESKFVSHSFSQQRAIQAIEQARATVDIFKELIVLSLDSGGMAERLGLLNILRFGLRISSPKLADKTHEWIEFERKVYKAVLRGNYVYKGADYDAVVVSTEGTLHGTADIVNLHRGMWLRLNRSNWPGVSNTAQLDEVKSQVSRLFGIQGEPDCNGINMEESTSPEQVSGGTIPANKVPEVIVDDRQFFSEESDTIEPTNTEEHIQVRERGNKAKTTPKVVEEHQLKKVFLGVDDARRPVFLDPQSPVDPLDNLNLMVTGSSGTGKTQFLKYLICKFREQGKNVLVLDFKNDFASDGVFALQASLERVFVSFDGLPFNPLIPYPVQHPGTGESFVQIGQHISGISSVLKRTYRLGTQQQVALKNSIVDAFSVLGIPTSGTSKYDSNLKYPDLGDIGETLLSSNLNAYNRLDPLFTLDLFRPSHKHSSFHSLVNRSLILDLSQIPSDEIRNTLAELVILSAHAYYNSQTHSGKIRQVLVLDEAHHVLGSDFMTSLVRECRAYGVSVVLSSQYPTDFPGEISSSMATKVLHSNGRDADKVRDIVQLLGCAGCDVDVANLDRFQAFVDNRHSPQTLIRTMNYPLYLVWSFLEHHGEATRNDVVDLDGIDTNKLPITNLVRQLERLGIAEEKDGYIRPLNQYEY